jgi:hypothetical protein
MENMEFLLAMKGMMNTNTKAIQEKWKPTGKK